MKRSQTVGEVRRLWSGLSGRSTCQLRVSWGISEFFGVVTQGSLTRWVFPKMVGFPPISHPKMVIFSRKTPRFVGYHILGPPQVVSNRIHVCCTLNKHLFLMDGCLMIATHFSREFHRLFYTDSIRICMSVVPGSNIKQRSFVRRDVW